MRQRSHAFFLELLQVTNSANLLMLMRLLTRTMKETDDDESNGNRNEFMTTMMRTKSVMRMMRMMGMMGMYAEDENEDEHEDGDCDEQGCCRVAKSMESSKRKPPNAVLVSRQVL